MVTKHRLRQRLVLMRLVSVIWAVMGVMTLIGCFAAAAYGDLSDLLMISAGIWNIGYSIKKAKKVSILKMIMVPFLPLLRQSKKDRRSVNSA